MADDIRIARWDLVATAGTTVSRPFTATTAVASLSVYTGGTITDVDDLTDATEHAATVDGDGLGGTITVDVSTGSSVPLRLVVDGAVVAVGRLTPSTSGAASRDDTVTIAVAESSTLTLDLPSIVAGEIASHPDLATHNTLGLATQAELDAEAATRAAADTALSDLVSTEQTVRAAADTALDGRLDTIEADYIQAADIASMETTAGAQTKADAAQAYAVQRANHTGTQTSAAISDFTEAVQDAVAALLGAGSNITLTYDDASDSLTIDATGGASYTDEEVRDAIGVALVGAGLISVTPNDALDTITITTTATANSTDAVLLARANHTGEQAIATVTGLQAALDAKAPLASPTFTGTPAAPTATAGTNTTQIATTAFVGTAVSNATSASAIVGKFTGTPDGTKYLRDDGTLATPAGGSGGFTVPYRAGQFIPSGGVSTFSTSSRAVTAATMYAQYLVVPSADTLDEIQTFINTAAGTNAVLAAYADDGTCYPGARIASGTITTGTTGYKTITGLASAVSAGLVWLVLYCDGAPAPLISSDQPSGALMPIGLPKNSINRRCFGISVARAWDGTAPATFPAGGTVMDTTNTGTPWAVGAIFS